MLGKQVLLPQASCSRTSSSPYFFSLQSELPKLSEPIDLLSFGKVDCQAQLEEDSHIREQLLELIAANQMKTAALGKATEMIQLLQEEQLELKKEITSLKKQLSFRQAEIKRLEKIVTDLDGLPQREKLTSNSSGVKMESLTGSKLFFSFSQTTPATKAKSFEMSTLQLKPLMSVSQELPPWEQTQKVLGGLKEAVSRQSEGESTLREIQDVVLTEQMESQMMKWEMEEKLDQIGDIIDEDLNLESFQDSFKSSSTDTEKQNARNQQQIVFQYEQIILGYRSYSAYLKAYFCETLNCLSKLGDGLSPSLPWQEKSLDYCLQQAREKVLANHSALSRQNRQLRDIVKGLIKILQEKVEVGR